MADWKMCVNEDCQYFRKKGKCHEVCKDLKIKRIITNADRIRFMNDEELAEFLEKIISGSRDVIGINCGNSKCENWKCTECIGRWLQSEAE